MNRSITSRLASPLNGGVSLVSSLGISILLLVVLVIGPRGTVI